MQWIRDGSIVRDPSPTFLRITSKRIFVEGARRFHRIQEQSLFIPMLIFLADDF
jgi:hypothetical protein